MTRIIGGTAGGRRIKTPVGEGTRPTSDRVREALFSAVDASLGSIVGLRFLDLYAGSGAVGLEARSRGAGSVTLVEKDRRAATLIRDNAGSLGLGRVDVVTTTVARAVAGGPSAPYDLVFADPPYATPNDELVAVLRLLLANGWLAHDASVAVERSRRSGVLSWPDGLEAVRERRYGDTTLWYGRPVSSTTGS
ncbi:MAG: 16S rRNA (guanine(966)-N(2))-methyltransferase RsmD [Nocardioidaceae bacterium]